VTDGSFVDCGGVEDVESECQSLSMVEGGRTGEESIVKAKPYSLVEFQNLAEGAIRLVGTARDFGTEAR
jgi:hypothetical protein